MILWTTLSPWQWALKAEESTDVFGRSSSFYTCQSADDGQAYAIVVIVFHATALLVANWWSYRARELETEYSESQYIGYALISELETIVLGTPFVVLLDSNPVARFFVQVGLVFLTSFVPLSLIFIPKMRSLGQLRARENPSQRRGLFSLYQARKRGEEFDPSSVEDGFRDDGPPDRDTSSGDDDQKPEAIEDEAKIEAVPTDAEQKESHNEEENDEAAMSGPGLRVSHHPKVRSCLEILVGRR